MAKGIWVGEKEKRKLTKGNGAFLLVEHDGESTKYGFLRNKASPIRQFN